MDWATLQMRNLGVVSVGSNSVTLIDTSTNSIKGVVYVGRAPDEAFFIPDGRELWVTMMGEDYISGIDPVAMRKENGRLNGPVARAPGEEQPVRDQRGRARS